MANRNKDKKEIDPEELLKRKFRAKCLFRALGRLVMANTYWLMESVEEYEGVDDVKRRVEQAVRGKTKQKQLLSVTDKALLNKPAEDRTDQERKYLYRIIGGLKCFKRYPNHVKRKLAALTYFKYYGPGRVIVRQHQEAHALYFIVAGDVAVSQTVYDDLLQQDVSTEIGLMHAGDMFGEVSLLHNINRTATVTTVGHCELLQLLKEDFKNVLLASVQKQWDEVRRAMSAFTYFDALDEVASREGCIVAKLKSFRTDETILGDGCGIPNYVYFILTGRVQMIEAIQVIVTKHLGHTYYTLHDPYVPKEESEQDFDKKWFAAYGNLNAESTAPKERSGSGVLPERATLSAATQTQKSTGGSILKLQGSATRGSTVLSPTNQGSAAAQEGAEKESSANVNVGVNTTDEYKRTSFQGGSTEAAGGQRTLSRVRHSDVVLSRKISGPEKEPSAAGSNLLLEPVEEGRPSVRYSVVPTPALIAAGHSKLKTYYMQVCQMNPGSTFGFGENMRDRRIVALCPVNCILMPKVWLLQRNTANIWTRIQYYLEKKIPNKQQLFDEFVSQRRWEEYRAQLVGDVVARSNTVNYTTVHDVPYSVRMEEMYDI